MASVSKTSHMRHIHPYPYTPAFEAVRSALLTVQHPKDEVERHRALMLTIMQAAQTYLLEILDRRNERAAFRAFEMAAVKALEDVRDADERARSDRLTSDTVEAEREKWAGDIIEIVEEPLPRDDGAEPTGLEEAVDYLTARRLRAGNKHEAPVFNFATAVVGATAGYFRATEDWEPILWQLSVYAHPKPMRVPADFADEMELAVIRVRLAAENFADEVCPVLAKARKVYVPYRDSKVGYSGKLGHALPPSSL